MKKNVYLRCLTKTNLALIGAGIFISAYIGHHNLGLPILNGFCTARSEIVLVDKGVAQPFFCYIHNFSFMTKTMKDASKVKYSSHTRTSAHETRKSLYSKFIIEKNAKNTAYHFILSHGLLTQFADYCRNVHIDDPHAACISILSTQIQEG